jgi:hypothetical protein
MPVCELRGCETRDALEPCGGCGLSVCGEHWSQGSTSICSSCSGDLPICEIVRCKKSEILRECYLCDRSVCSNHWIEHVEDLVDGDHCSRCFIR